MPLGPGPGGSGSRAPRIGDAPFESGGPEYKIGRCKRCGKEAELDEGLCPECKWEIQVGMKPPLEQEKKHHFWSRKH